MWIKNEQNIKNIHPNVDEEVMLKNENTNKQQTPHKGVACSGLTLKFLLYAYDKNMDDMYNKIEIPQFSAKSYLEQTIIWSGIYWIIALISIFSMKDWASRVLIAVEFLIPYFAVIIAVHSVYVVNVLCTPLIQIEECIAKTSNNEKYSLEVVHFFRYVRVRSLNIFIWYWVTSFLLSLFLKIFRLWKTLPALIFILLSLIPVITITFFYWKTINHFKLKK